MATEVLPTLVEEEGPAVGDLEQTVLVLDGSGKGPLLMAEQLRLQQASPAGRRS